MTDKASVEMETQSEAAFDSINEIIENLKKYSKVFDTSLVYQDFLQKSERYLQAIPSSIMQEVQEDYRKRNIEADAKLEEDKQNFVSDYEKYVAEREEILVDYQSATDRIKELRFRHILGEFEEDDINRECNELRDQLLEKIKRLTWLDELLDLYKILGVDILEGSQFPEKKQEAAPVEEFQSLEERPENMLTEETPSEASDDKENIDADLSLEEDGMSSGDSGELMDSLLSDENFFQKVLEDEGPEPETIVAAELGSVCVLEGKHKGERIPLEKSKVSIGQSENNDIRLEDPGIAEFHAEITYKDGKYFLENLDVLGRCLVNGMQKTNKCELKDGDTVSFGGFKMRIEF